MPDRRWLLAVLTAVAMLVLGGVSAARADWPLAGVRVAGPANLRTVLADGAGGAFVVFTPPGDSLRVLRISDDGSIAAGWPATGRGVSNRHYLGAAADGLGGVYVACSRTWYVDYGSEWLSSSAFSVWRLLGDGSLAPGWPDTGKVVSTASNCAPSGPVAGYADGFGGVYLIWLTTWYAGDGVTQMSDSHDGVHVRGDGTISMGSAGGTDGWWRPDLTLDGAGGVASVYTYGWSTYAGRWAPNGGQVARQVFDRFPDPVEAGVVELPPSSDVLVYWRRGSFIEPDTNTYRLVRLDTLLQARPGWPATGAAFRSVPMMGDGQGGAFLLVDDGGLKLQRITMDTPAPVSLWPANALPAYQAGPNALDGSGGLIHIWFENTSVPSVQRMKAIHWTGAGHVPAPWAADGNEIAPATRAPYALAASGAGRAIVAWTDAGADSGAIYLQLLADDAPVPVACSLVDTDASADHVRIEWQVSGATNAPLVQRRSGDGAWAELGDATATEYERWAFEDRDVRPGDVLDYRLLGADGALAGSEATVRVPLAAVLALRGFLENPSRDATTIEFTLPGAGPATLELFDVAGRVVARREVGSLGAGTHRIALSEGGTLEPGLWFVRLRTARQSLVTRGVRIR